MDKTEHLKKEMVHALEKSLGIVSTACKSVGISRTTHYKWIKEDTQYQQDVESVEGITLDFAESQLFKQIKEGNTTATIFYLKTKGRNRGYVERTQLEVTKNESSLPDYFKSVQRDE